MSNEQNFQNYQKPRNTGVTPAIIACVFAILGIFLFGIIFVPIATIFAIISTIVSILNRNSCGFGISIAAWILIVVAFFVSPVLIALVLGIIGASTV